MGEVVRAVVLQQVIQTAVGWWVVSGTDDTNHGHAMQRLFAVLAVALKLFIGNDSASHILQLHGAAIVFWLYWWIIPTFQFLFAM